MCILPNPAPDDTPSRQTPAACRLSPARREHLLDHEVSRKFVYQQAAKAEQTLDTAFADPDPAADRVLFHLPVTKAWLQQRTLGLVLICHSSYRGVHKRLRDLFDYPLSVGTIHKIVRRAATEAQRHNEAANRHARPASVVLPNPPVLNQAPMCLDQSGAGVESM